MLCKHCDACFANDADMTRHLNEKDEKYHIPCQILKKLRQVSDNGLRMGFQYAMWHPPLMDDAPIDDASSGVMSVTLSAVVRCAGKVAASSNLADMLS